MDWINNFEKLMFYSNNKEALLESINIKYINMPSLLYKYRSISEQSINAFKGDYLYAVAPKCLNDPNEGILCADYDRLWKGMFLQLIKYLQKKTGINALINLEAIKTKDEMFVYVMKRFQIQEKDWSDFKKLHIFTNAEFQTHLKEFEKGVIDVGNEIYRICSLSSKYDSNTMWSHYADEHKGFCIGYDIKSLNDNLTELTFPVRYKKELIQIDDSFIRNSSDMHGMLLINSLSVKSLDWSYENEWRIIIGKTVDDCKQKIDLPGAREVILGLNIEAKDKEVLIKVARDKKINCYQMVRKSGTFDLIKMPI